MLELNIQLSRDHFHMAVYSHIDHLATGLFGPSGSGKSSLLNCLAGLTTPDRGRIVLNHRVLYDSQQGINLPPHRRRVGMVFQDSLLLPHLTVQGNLAYGMPRIPRTERDAQVTDMADILGIRHRLDALPRELSGGEKQRVALGRTVLAQPDLILLDEPFSGLDQALKNTLLPFVRQLHTCTCIPIILVSHDLSDIQSLTNHILWMEHGHVVAPRPMRHRSA